MTDHFSFNVSDLKTSREGTFARRCLPFMATILRRATIYYRTYANA